MATRRSREGRTVTELPDAPVEPGRLTARQGKVLDVIRESVERRGYPPSMREIGEAVGLASPSSVSHQLAALQRKGYLRRDPNRPRAMEVVSPQAIVGQEDYDETDSSEARPTPSYVPVVG